MSDERLLKRGRLAELEDEKKMVEAKTRAYITSLRNTFDNAFNLPHFDLEMASVVVKELGILKERYLAVWQQIQDLRKDLGL